MNMLHISYSVIPKVATFDLFRYYNSAVQVMSGLKSAWKLELCFSFMLHFNFVFLACILLEIGRIIQR